jgi:HAD superfamily hydrolase (TIGR01509 family)
MNKAIFWDFDGTITYSEHLWSTAAFRAAPDTERYGITFEDIRRHMANGFPWHDENLKLVLKGQDFWTFLFKKFSLMYQSFGINEREALEAAGQVRNNILDAGNYRVYADAEETLEICKQKGYKNYILSNNYPELEAMIDKLGLASYFDGYSISGVIGHNKPRPEIFAHALAIAQNPDVRYMIGDNPKADIIGGNAAGMRTILVHNNEKSDAAFSSEFLNNIADILE